MIALLHEEKAIASKPFEPPDTVASVDTPDRPPSIVDSKGMNPEEKQRLVERLSEILKVGDVWIGMAPKMRLPNQICL